MLILRPESPLGQWWRIVATDAAIITRWKCDQLDKSAANLLVGTSPRCSEGGQQAQLRSEIEDACRSARAAARRMAAAEGRQSKRRRLPWHGQYIRESLADSAERPIAALSSTTRTVVDAVSQTIQPFATFRAVHRTSGQNPRAPAIPKAQPGESSPCF